jgi:acetaldehyde dehydrogenase/alcohol dehydrogenase
MIGCKGSTDEELTEELILRIRALIRAVGLPSSIREAIGEKGTEEEFKASVDKMSEEAFDDQCTSANPRYPSVEEIKSMYLNAYYGKQE